MKLVTTILQQLGFGKVVGILDGNRVELRATLSQAFPGYHFFCIPANDVRTKNASLARAAVKGLLDAKNERVRDEYVEELKRQFSIANQYLQAHDV